MSMRHVYLGTKDGKVFLFPESAIFLYDADNNKFSAHVSDNRVELDLNNIKNASVESDTQDLLGNFFEWICAKVDSLDRERTEAGTGTETGTETGSGTGNAARGGEGEGHDD